ncbi:hypothetical protein [Planococcus lenghuensis]|uniref:Lipoprotein n=1 Tax=Planococcus lenghuensis TaxID=2213202 RepID=A0A1Q2KZE2_9BACL|nr:hypothetical protein [Planococcus lenghuensis]AQQ53569.1 hypothetical protein B0X71_11120 [Planococcus lenghuensis]
MRHIQKFLLLFSLALLVSGCDSGGQNLDNQKLISYSTSLSTEGQGDNDKEKWNVYDRISGEFYNLEELSRSIHSFTITPLFELDDEEITLTLKANNEAVGYYTGESERETFQFTAERNDNGDFVVEQGTFLYFHTAENFMDEVFSLEIKHNSGIDKVTLR